MATAIEWNTPALEAIKNRAMTGILTMAYDLAAESRSGNPGAPVKTGNLKASIRVEPTSLGANVIAGGPFNGFRIDYAKKQEFTNPNGHAGYMGKPFERLFSNNKWVDKYFGKVTG